MKLFEITNKSRYITDPQYISEMMTKVLFVDKYTIMRGDMEIDCEFYSNIEEFPFIPDYDYKPGLPHFINYGLVETSEAILRLSEFDSYDKDWGLILPSILSGNLCIKHDPKFPSLAGISDKLKRVNGLIQLENTHFIKKGILNLLHIECAGFGVSDRAKPEWYDIIRKYINKPEDMFECQAELIDNGLEEYTEL